MVDLSGVWAKVGRAEELLQTIDHEVGVFLNQYRNPVIVQRDPDQLVDRFIWNIPDPPPDHIALLIGDVLHNLRSSLDHIVWALSVLNQPTIPKRYRRTRQFPDLP
jgi:hypothetical protein